MFCRLCLLCSVLANTSIHLSRPRSPLAASCTRYTHSLRLGDGQRCFTHISLVAIDRSDPEAFALAEVIVCGVNAGLERYLQERPLLRQCTP